MGDLLGDLLESKVIRAHPPAREIAAVLCAPTGRSSAGYPYLARPAWERLRDWVPHILGDGPVVLAALDTVLEAAGPRAETLEPAAQVVRQVVRTAAVTAPPDLWLLRQVLSTWRQLGLLDRLAEGEPLDLGTLGLDEEALRIDLELLMSRGLLVQYRSGVLRSDHRTAWRVLAEIIALSSAWPADLAARWAAAARGATADRDLLLDVVGAPKGGVRARPPPAWIPDLEDIEIGWRLVPLVTGLHAAGRLEAVLAGGPALPDADLDAAARAVWDVAGIARGGALTPLGRRVLERGPGPFGIIEAYHPTMERLDALLSDGAAAVSVARGANIAASQHANARTFQRLNDALDRFCRDTGFTYGVFIEHAVGRGEATRQRWERRPDADLAYFGADLEQAAIAAASDERSVGHLPPGLVLVQADIGQPDALVDALAAHGASAEGAVMLVGNGFHEVRDASDAKMIDVMAGYERAGIVLLFTEESALTVDDLMQTAWNTYHAGFRYVHSRSGQGLRPAVDAPPSQRAASLPTSWTTCAEAAGYVRASAWCSRSRTIYPYPPATGHNPAISVNHFFVPSRIAARLGIVD